MTAPTITSSSLFYIRLRPHVLAPGQIASPIRGLLAEQENTSVMLGEVIGIDTNSRQVIVDSDNKVGLRISYDYLVLATGATHSYFGHDEFAKFAPGLKSLADAESLRNHILMSFERAEIEEDPDLRKALITFVMVGAGPTGVEMASAIAVMIRTTLRKDFRRIAPESARIVLADMGQRPLGTFSEKLSEAARLRLLELGVEVRLGKAVQSIDEDGVILGDERIPSRSVIWTAGVAPSIPGRQMAWVRSRSCWPRSYPARPNRSGASGHLCHRRHVVPGSGRPALAGRCAGCNAARKVHSQVFLSEGDIKISITSVPVFR